MKNKFNLKTFKDFLKPNGFLRRSENGYKMPPKDGLGQRFFLLDDVFSDGKQDEIEILMKSSIEMKYTNFFCITENLVSAKKYCTKFLKDKQGLFYIGTCISNDDELDVKLGQLLDIPFVSRMIFIDNILTKDIGDYLYPKLVTYVDWRGEKKEIIPCDFRSFGFQGFPCLYFQYIFFIDRKNGTGAYKDELSRLCSMAKINYQTYEYKK